MRGERGLTIGALLDAMVPETAVVDADGCVVAINRAWEAAAGAAVGTDLVAVWRAGGERLAPAAEAVERVLDGSPATVGLEHALGGEEAPRWVSLTVVALEHAGGGALVSRTDITDRRATEVELEHRALRDPLTGLANRRLFVDRLRRALSRRSRRAGSPAVIYVDIDRFKQVNDTQGHAAGDRLLLAVARRLESLVRPEDTVARLGGDEFAVLCEDLSDDTHGARLAARIVDGMGAGRLAGTGFVGVSVGLALAPDDTDAEALLRDADAAMYRAKERGRGRFEVFDRAMRKRIVRRLEIADALRRAFAAGQFRLVYQPVIDLKDGRITAVESLLRWEHPELGRLSPADFIGVAEDNGLILSIGGWVVGEACRQLAAWTEAYGEVVPHVVSVNVSVRQIVEPGFADVISAALAASGIGARRLAIELTESVLLDEAGGGRHALAGLRDLGVALVLDDFGTGYSSLTYLRRLPLDAVKIDRSFVAELDAVDVDRSYVSDADPDSDPRSDDGAIVRAAVQMVQSLGKHVVAEGVESPKQLKRLRALGCDYAQGFHLARPFEAEAFSLQLARQAARGEARAAPPWDVVAAGGAGSAKEGWAIRR